VSAANCQSFRKTSLQKHQKLDQQTSRYQETQVKSQKSHKRKETQVGAGKFHKKVS
jgi:hypothetical protein